MALKGGRIKDSIHGYVAFTRIEREFLDDPLTQRLRWISQSGLAHYVFPEVRTSRFAHSIGAMHLGSRFLAGALANTPARVLEPLEAAMREAVEEAAGGELPDPGEVVSMLVTDGLLSAREVSRETVPYALMIEQGLRLAALFHDLGHLPFSHDFEYALERVFEADPEGAGARFPALCPEASGFGGPPIHETIGHQLAEALFHKLHRDVFAGSPLDALSRCVMRIAERILHHAAPPLEQATTPDNVIGPDSVWWLMHTLMAGELDVDRCDYLLRDALAYGFEFISYDLDRLVANLILLRPRADRALIDLGVRPQGVAAAESLLIARYRAYQWGPFHHKVAQLEAALEHVMREIVEETLAGSDAHPSLAEFLGDIELIAATEPGRLCREHAPLLERFIERDDIWWMTILRERLRTHGEDPWLTLVCRRTRGHASLWKRPDQFPGDLEAFNRLLPARTDIDGRRRWNAAVDALGPEVLVARHDFTPWRAGADPATSALCVLSPDGVIVPLTELSHIVASLREAWARDVQVQAFATREIDAGPVVDHLREALTG